MEQLRKRRRCLVTDPAGNPCDGLIAGFQQERGFRHPAFDHITNAGWRKPRSCWKPAMSPSHGLPAGSVTRQRRRSRSSSIDITAYRLAGTEQRDALTAAEGKETFRKR